ncbi:MAG TPA: serine hydrolase domain-containing protein [Gammaproteobacteria bacterium]|nr:serine hydrolase domain-containing protein [Gammaproteobacteria bacterium]
MSDRSAGPPIGGTCDARFARVREVFRDNFQRHGEHGAAVAVYVDRRRVAALHGGHADAARRHAWGPDTLVNVFSVGKGVVAIAALMLSQQGRLDLDAPVARWWPDFISAGKEDVSLRQILSHRAGLPAVGPPLPEEALFDWQRMCDALAAQAPWWPPGTRHGYHVNTFGFLVGELVRRASGRSLGQYVREHIAGPLEADFCVGVPAPELGRVAEFLWPEQGAGPAGRPGPRHPDPGARMLYNTYFNPPGLSGHGVVNSMAWRRAEIPSANAHATADGVARVYANLVGGERLLGSGILREATREASFGTDAVLARETRFGLGFQLPQPGRDFGPGRSSFGHFGAGGSVGFADPEAGVGFGYVMNRMGPRWQSPAAQALIEAVYACL